MKHYGKLHQHLTTINFLNQVFPRNLPANLIALTVFFLLCLLAHERDLPQPRPTSKSPQRRVPMYAELASDRRSCEVSTGRRVLAIEVSQLFVELGVAPRRMSPLVLPCTIGQRLSQGEVLELDPKRGNVNDCALDAVLRRDRPARE